MRILIASSEVHPYSKSGGLADMVGAMAKALGKTGREVGVVTPLYRGIRERVPSLKRFDWEMRLPLGSRWIDAAVWQLQPHPHVTIYFIDVPEFYDRDQLYQVNGVDYPDNADRFIFLSKAIVHLARYLPWQPSLVHVHDWQTGLVPLLIQHQRLAEGWNHPPPTVLTIHNLAYQGIFPATAFRLSNLPPDYFNLHGAEFYGYLNSLKTGIVFADQLTTVSPRYAREITTPAFGCGLDAVLRARQDRLAGILNGVDYEEWNTNGNPYLPASYSPSGLAGKSICKTSLQRECGLPVRRDVPMFANISRLADQKGIELLLGALEEMVPNDLQFVQLGNGEPRLEHAFQSLSRRYPGKVFSKIGFDVGLSHRIEAGADFFVMPSRFEPCGLNQMYSLIYGTIPIVRMTGGLDDSVIDPKEDPKAANGIKFGRYAVSALVKAIRKALALYRQPEVYVQFQKRAMRSDFSWEVTERKYIQLYKDMLARTPGGGDSPIRAPGILASKR